MNGNLLVGQQYSTKHLQSLIFSSLWSDFTLKSMPSFNFENAHCYSFYN